MHAWLLVVSIVANGLSAEPCGALLRLCSFASVSASPAVVPGSTALLHLSVRPSVSFAPATAIVVATVEHDADNRGLTVETSSAEYYTSSYRQLDGEFEARTHKFFLQNLPAGVYQVKAVVFGVGGDIVGFDTETIEVRK